MTILWLVPVISLTASQAPAESAQETIAYVNSLRGLDGGFRADRSARAAGGSTIRATLAGLRALRYFGGNLRDPEACRRFVASCRDRTTGGYAPQPAARADSISTSLALMVLAELHAPVDERALPYLAHSTSKPEEIRLAAAALEATGAKLPEARGWIEQLQASPNSRANLRSDGDSARDMASAVVTLLRLGAPSPNRDSTLRVLRAGQRGDGGFGRAGASDLESCYRVLRAFSMLKAKPTDVPACRRFIERCRNTDGGYGLAPGQPSNIAATYFAGIALHWLAE